MPDAQKKKIDPFVLKIIEDESRSDVAQQAVSKQGILVRDLDVRVGGHTITDTHDGGWALLPTAMTLLDTVTKSYAWKNVKTLQPFFWHWADLQGNRCCESRLMWNVTHRGPNVTISSIVKVPETLGGEYHDMSRYKVTIPLDEYRFVIVEYVMCLLELHEAYPPRQFESPNIEKLYWEQVQQLRASVEVVMA